jgi:hypothetical protein
MKGTSTKLHSRAVKVLKFLLSKSTFTTIHDKFPNGQITLYLWHVVIFLHISCTALTFHMLYHSLSSLAHLIMCCVMV